jgi:hypothetical protein
MTPGNMTIRLLLALLLIALISSGCSTKPRALASLNQPEAHALAEKLAFEKYGWVFGDVAPKGTPPPKLVSGHWVWVWRRGSGHGDIEIKVSFAPDGSSPNVDCEFSESGEYIPRR